MNIASARDNPTVSIVVNNYNYARYLPHAIDSTLAQTYPHIQIVVVDDGSTDESRHVIESYGHRVVPLFKANGGQASAFNASLGVCTGDIVIFLDADDMLLSSAVEAVVQHFRQPGVVKVHSPMWVVDGHGHRTGAMVPGRALPEGDLRDRILQDGPQSCVAPPTSGNAWAKTFLEKVFPLPEDDKRLNVGAASWDNYLSALAPLFGNVAAVSTPQGLYRVHGRNDYSGKTYYQTLKRNVETYDRCCDALEHFCRKMNLPSRREHWLSTGWFHQIRAGLDDILSLVPAGEQFILIDEDQWGTSSDIEGRRRIPFPENSGQYWGPPPDDAAAIAEIERLRATGAAFCVLAWPAFPWLSYYPVFHRHLSRNHRRLLSNDRVILFDMAGIL
jgi:glycosyltransferase involved in cell wall biosynthesis